MITMASISMDNKTNELEARPERLLLDTIEKAERAHTNKEVSFGHAPFINNFFKNY